MDYLLLRVDLTKQKYHVERLNYDRLIRRFLGGRGLGAYLALKEIPKGIDPLSPENKLFILTGPLTAVAVSTKATAVAKSPLTGSYTHSKISGNFPYWLRKAGYDGVVLEGKSEEPVYISIIDGEVKFHSAKHIWGKTVSETMTTVMREQKIDNEHKCGIVAIGPTGENLVRFASIMGSATMRAFGRGGLGAVMGSKRVKAIIVKGNRDFLGEAYDKKKVLELGTSISSRIAKSSGKEPYYLYGTSGLVNVINSIGALPTRNFETGVFVEAANISGENLAEKYLELRHGCLPCSIVCSKLGRVPSGKFAVSRVKYEYECIWALGANLGIGDPEAVLYMIKLANEYGIDCISLGNTLATAIELSKKGKLPLNLNWGDADAVIELIHNIAQRKDIGKELAEGGYYLAMKYGDPEAFVGSRGQGFPAYDPRGLKGFAIAYVTANRGGDHNEAWPPLIELGTYPFWKYPDKQFDPLGEDREKVEFVVFQQNYYAVYDSLAWCNFYDQIGADSVSPQEIVELLNAYAGWDLAVDELFTIGERIFNTERLFHVREGKWVRDELPPKMKRPLPEGPAKGHSAERFFEWAIKEYYKLRGWEDGKPTEETLRRLGLEEFLDIIKGK